MKNKEQVFTMRCNPEFIKLCKLHSNKFTKKSSINCGSAAHFIRECAKEKFMQLGIKKEFLDSII
jgi:hypothetical protein